MHFQNQKPRKKRDEGLHVISEQTYEETEYKSAKGSTKWQQQQRAIRFQGGVSIQIKQEEQEESPLSPAKKENQEGISKAFFKGLKPQDLYIPKGNNVDFVKTNSAQATNKIKTNQGFDSSLKQINKNLTGSNKDATESEHQRSKSSLSQMKTPSNVSQSNQSANSKQILKIKRENIRIATSPDNSSSNEKQSHSQLSKNNTLISEGLTSINQASSFQKMQTKDSNGSFNTQNSTIKLNMQIKNLPNQSPDRTGGLEEIDEH